MADHIHRRISPQVRSAPGSVDMVSQKRFHTRNRISAPRGWNDCNLGISYSPTTEVVFIRERVKGNSSVVREGGQGWIVSLKRSRYASGRETLNKKEEDAKNWAWANESVSR